MAIFPISLYINLPLNNAIPFEHGQFYGTGRCGSLSSDAVWNASGTKIDPRVRHILL